MIQIQITLTCSQCSAVNIVKNGINTTNKQNYLCNDCNCQFIADHNLSYCGCASELTKRITKMLVRGCGITDIAEIEEVSIKKVLSVLTGTHVVLEPKKAHYDQLEVDEFWTYVGKKKKKIPAHLCR